MTAATVLRGQNVFVQKPLLRDLDKIAVFILLKHLNCIFIIMNIKEHYNHITTSPKPFVI